MKAHYLWPVLVTAVLTGTGYTQENDGVTVKEEATVEVSKFVKKEALHPNVGSAARKVRNGQTGRKARDSKAPELKQKTVDAKDRKVPSNTVNVTTKKFRGTKVALKRTKHTPSGEKRKGTLRQKNRREGR